MIMLETWTHSGLPWSWWKNAGQFLYVFGELRNDNDPPLMDFRQPLKIGITTNPKSRLSALRNKAPHGTWFAICWMENSAPLCEKALHELFTPWRCGFEREWFVLPLEVENWLFEGMEDNWSRVAKQDRLCKERLEQIVTEIMPRYYFAPWLEARIEQLNALYL